MLHHRPWNAGRPRQSRFSGRASARLPAHGGRLGRIGFTAAFVDGQASFSAGFAGMPSHLCKGWLGTMVGLWRQAQSLRSLAGRGQRSGAQVVVLLHGSIADQTFVICHFSEEWTSMILLAVFGLALQEEQMVGAQLRYAHSRWHSGIGWPSYCMPARGSAGGPQPCGSA